MYGMTSMTNEWIIMTACECTTEEPIIVEDQHLYEMTFNEDDAKGAGTSITCQGCKTPYTQRATPVGCLRVYDDETL